MLRKTIFRLLLTYLVPLVLLTLYFHLQSIKLFYDSRLLHLESIAEYQANTFDLFLQERVVNLTNLIQDPRLEKHITSQLMALFLDELKRTSDAFVDIGIFSPAGVQIAYAGPFGFLENQNYSKESWYLALRRNPGNFIITDIYLGFRQKPHFTIAVSRIINGQYLVLRATLAPEKIYEYITSLKGAREVCTTIVNQDGLYQVVTPNVGNLLQTSSIIPPFQPRQGAKSISSGQKGNFYGYSWLKMADWALMVQFLDQNQTYLSTGVNLNIFLVSVLAILLIFMIIIFRARKIVQFQEESQQTRAQLEHAAKLATVGEMAAGIAHEINNPLAIICEEAGLAKDLMDPQFGQKLTPEDMTRYLDAIQEAVFRCRDITRKLLGFVRKTDINLAQYDVNDIITNFLEGFLTRELTVSNIEILQKLEPQLPKINADKNQLEQVLLNIINNAVDAIQGSGKITIITSRQNQNVHISIIDTGIGMNREQMEKIFLPFYSTKEVGKGTGLGLSVSYGIIKSLGGEILVDSVPGQGSSFTISLPIR